MINKIKAWLHAYKIYDSDIGTSVVPTTHQQDSQGVKSRVRRMFESQKEQMNARALVAHHCKEPDICTKNPCFVYTPDKVVAESVVKIPKKRRTSMSMFKKD